MKKIFLFSFFLSAFFLLNAQAPQGISYQAVVRDANGNVIANQQVQFRFTILQDAYNGQAVFQEVQNTTTNSLGIANLTIGYGVPYIGNISEIDWGNHSHFLRVEIDPQANNNFTELGVTQLVSVPYALFANICGNAVTYTAGNGIDITNGVITNIAPDQIVTLNAGSGVSITGSYPNFTITSNATEYTAGNGISINNGVITNTAPDQTLNIVAGTGISISGSYPNYTINNIAPDQSITLNAGNGINITGTYPSYTIQHVPHTGDVSGTTALTVTGIQNRAISSTAPSTNQVLKWNGTSWSPANDENTTYTAGTGLTLTGTTFSHSAHTGDVSGTTSLTVTGVQNKPISSTAPQSGQVLRYDGTQWAPANPSSVITAGTGLSYSGNTLNSVWTTSGNNIYNNNTGNVGVGETNPTAKLTVKDVSSELLFQVKDKLGRPVFEIYQDSIVAYISPTATKTNKGAFVINPKMDSGKPTGSGKNYLRITPDSTRVLTEDPLAGFGVKGLSGTTSTNYMKLTPENYFIGHESGKNITTGKYNSILGYQAGKVINSGKANTLFGYQSGYNLTTGNSNIFIGARSGYLSTTANDNIFIGDSAGLSNVSGMFNVYIGPCAGQLTIGNGNTFIGSGAGQLGTSGNLNTFIGNAAGMYNKGSSNVYIGAAAGFQGQNSNNNIFIGTNAGYNETGSNKLYIENSNANSSNALIYGEFDNDVLRFNAKVGVGIYPIYRLHVEANQATGAGTGLAHFVNTATSNDAAGIYASCKSSDYYGSGGYFEGGFRGVYGRVSPTGSYFYYGVYGMVAGGSGTNYAVYGNASGTGTNYGIYGFASGGATNYAGYFNGNVHVNGTLSKNAGSFMIDHPLDPENKYLIHSFVESPDMKNVYDGVVVLDNNGEAIVELPSYFEVLNKDFRYQLTPIGSYAPVYIKSEIQNNKFTIAGGIPGMKVCWQVTGVRKDPYAVAYPIIPELEKKPNEKGKYLNPELYNQPEEKGIHYVKEKKENTFNNNLFLNKNQ